MLALQAMTPERLAAAVPEVTLAEARKLVAQVHRGEVIAASAHVRKRAAEAVRAVGEVPTLRVLTETASAIDPFVKYLLESRGARFETVRIPLEHPDRFTVCVSSQVGCALACAFCATGRLGLERNLEPWEIVEQVRVVRARLPRGRCHGVVFQGMGEPLANLDAVLAAIAVMTDPCALGIDARAITVCTAGLPAGIRRLAKEAPNVRLGLSMSSAIAANRKKVMPIADRFDLDDVIAACAEHVAATGHAPMWAVTLLDGVNDSVDDAQALLERAERFHAMTGKRPRISIVAYNPILARSDSGDAKRTGLTEQAKEGLGEAESSIGDGDPFHRSTREAAFRAVLSAAGMPSHRRYSGGSDVAAACGQLAATP